MIHRKRFITVVIGLMLASVTAYAQANEKVWHRRAATEREWLAERFKGQAGEMAQQRREAINEAVKAIGLDRDQVAKIREIGSERPPEGILALGLREWRDGITAKLMAVLSAEQKTRLEGVKGAGSDSKALAGAVLLGLAKRPRQN